MKKRYSKSVSWAPAQHPALPYLLLLLALFVAGRLSAQCYCKEVEIVPGSPGQSYFPQYDPHYDQNGVVVSYDFDFQFECLAEPLSVDKDFYTYVVLYRPAGSNEDWQMADDDVYDPYDYMVTVPNLLPGVLYEFRVNCPCPNPGCDAYEQVDNFLLNDEPLNNVTSPWNVIHCPLPGLGSVKNMQVAEIDYANNSARIVWQYAYLPPSVKAEYRIKNNPALPWITLDDPSAAEYTLTGLEKCYEYEFRVTVEAPCPNNSRTISFKLAECAATITGVSDINGTMATVNWESSGDAAPDDYLVSWWHLAQPNNVMTATTSGYSHTLTNLNPSSIYHVKVSPNCGASAACSDNSQVWVIQTNCDIHEFNGSFEKAAEINQDQSYDANISPVDDEDFYAFTAECERVQIAINHPDFFTGILYDVEYLTNLAYKVYDENFNEVPADYLFFPSNLYYRTFYALQPGHQYYLKIYKSPTQSNWDIDQQRKCYTFSVQSCNFCYDPTINFLYGDQSVTALPSEVLYSLVGEEYFQYTDVDWNIAAGQATITPTNDPLKVLLGFEVPGSVTLTASVERCDGAVMTYPLNISVSGTCSVSGYIKTQQGTTIPLQSSNSLLYGNYGIKLTLPSGVTTFTWTLVSGQATFTINGTTIKVVQSSQNAQFKLTLTNGGCAGEMLFYSFQIGGWATPGFETGAGISPNPVLDLLTIHPVAPQQPGEAPLSEHFEATLFNPYSSIVRTLRGNSLEGARMDCTDLPAGLYTLRLDYGGAIRTFVITKI